jgi:ribosome-associated protein
LAASVRDAVRDAGFAKPRMEGEENGEWIIVDCGSAVVHIMQPAIRQYYHLEDLWGGKPVRLKFGAVQPAVPVKTIAVKKVGTKTMKRSG